jgi:HEPN domain-containing protein
VRARRHPNYDAAGFHAQQMAEKYFKAFLQEHGITFPRTHDLIELLELCLPIDFSFELQRPASLRLNRYAIRYRYPGESADKEEARQAFRLAKDVRKFFRQRLGID